MKDIRGIRVLEQNIEVEQNYGYFPIIVGEDYHVSRDVLYELLRKNNYFARKYFFPLTSDQACFKNKYVNSKLTVARELSKKVLVLPMYETLDFENQKEILDIICKN